MKRSSGQNFSSPISILLFVLFVASLPAQSDRRIRVLGDLNTDLRDFVAVPAIPGYEKELAAEIRKRLENFVPVTDSLGDVVVTTGSGAPRRLLVAPMDEPGYVVSGVTDDGYLRVQRLPQLSSLPLFDDLYSAQPVRIQVRSGRWIHGVVAGTSIHLQPLAPHPVSPIGLDEIYVDIGASTAVEARHAGADLLSPMVMERELRAMGFDKLAAPAVGDRFGDAALVEFLHRVDLKRIKGTLTVAFVTQQWSGARGLQRVLEKVHPDEMIYLGRLLPSGPIPGTANLRRAPRRELGSGILLGLTEPGGAVFGFAADLKQLAEANKIKFATDYSAPLWPPSYLPAPELPPKWAHLGIAVAWPATPAEMIDENDLQALEVFLEAYAQGPQSSGGAGGAKSGGLADPPVVSPPSRAEDLLPALVETYGVSGHEAAVRDLIKRQLPAWAKPETDSSGNLILRVSSALPGLKTPRILVIAHMDEIGFEVKSIAQDGRLEVESRGRLETRYFAGHPALVHTSKGTVPGLMELPDGWDQPGFQWPEERGPLPRVDVGARTPEETAKLGVAVGDSITIPKAYRKLFGSRANGRSFDDRVGCAAVVSAVRALGPDGKGRDITFVWSTGEELGLFGAAALAKRLAAEGRVPDYVFAIDTFVSSDSPLESKRFADAELGKGFVIRAVDLSNVVPRDMVARLVNLARVNQIPVQYGVTSGGNDGSAFLRYGSVDVALGWPLRYSHSPGEVIDARDVEALARIVAVIAKSW